jgi:hypothetical protein
MLLELDDIDDDDVDETSVTRCVDVPWMPNTFAAEVPVDWDVGDELNDIEPITSRGWPRNGW